jgi:hypothetical protein
VFLISFFLLISCFPAPMTLEGVFSSLQYMCQF